MKTLLLFVVLAVPLSAGAQDAPVPVDQEPLHKMVLKNDYVEVMRVTLPPGQSTLLHTHSHDGVAVRLSESVISMDVPGKASSGPRAQRAGDVSAQSYAKAPFTHRVNNVGTTPFDVLDIEILRRPEGPPTEAITAPAAEHDSARVYRWELAPGAKTPEHRHRRPYLIVAATAMQLHMQAPDGREMEHPVVAGDVHWVDQAVTHVLTNSGQAAGVLVEVEVK
jgi:quercetin dioxygenase-like cupin family protein